MWLWPRRKDLAIAPDVFAKGAAELEDEVARFERSLEKAAKRAVVTRRRPRCRPPALKARRPRVHRRMAKGIPAGLSTIDCVQPRNLQLLSLETILSRLGRLRIGR